jgi:hypothetical protein
MTGWQRLSVAGMGAWTLLTGLWAWTDWSYIDGPQILTVWLAPPSVVFLVVWTTRWVYSGFRGK